MSKENFLPSAILALALSLAVLFACSQSDSETAATTDTPSTPAPATPAVPGAPTGLAVQTATGTTLTLAWSAAAGATSYSIYRSTSAAGTFTAVKTGLTVLTFRDRDLAQTTSYWYKVSATNSVGEGVQSSALSASTVSIMVSTLAGSGVSGNDDGQGTAATFNLPYSIAVDPSGNLFVADANNHTIRKITPAGLVSTFAGTAGTYGSTDSAGGAPQFRQPLGVGTDASGNVYVDDSGNNTVRKITPAGVVTTLAGTAGVTGSADATGAAASFNGIYSVAADAAGNLYVTDSLNSLVRKCTPAGVVTTFAGANGIPGSADGTGTAATFQTPAGAAADAEGNVYVSDIGNHNIRKITPAGVVSTLAGDYNNTGSSDGTGTAATFLYPTGLAVDAWGIVYVADRDNALIRKITPAGVVTTIAGRAGSGDADGTAAAAMFTKPCGISASTLPGTFTSRT